MYTQRNGSTVRAQRSSTADSGGIDARRRPVAADVRAKTPPAGLSVTALLASTLALACTGDDRTSKSDNDGGAAISEGSSGIGEVGNDEIDSFDPETEGGAGEGGEGIDSQCTNPDGTKDGDGDSYDFSVIWIANSENGTVSKVDTRKAVELARYRTGPHDRVNPSRTSVSLRGDVAVANRQSGTIVKIAARQADCLDTNGDGVIQTSTGRDDVLPWGEDECVLWEHDVGFTFQNDQWSKGGPRALAWEPGGDDPEDPCALEARLWVGWRDWQNGSASSPSVIRRLAPDGTTDAEVEIGNWPGGSWEHGLYGGAADVDGNFWGMGSDGILLRVDAETLEVKSWTRSGSAAMRRFYGIALDGQGNPWLSTYDEFGLVKFDVERERFEEIGPAPVENPIVGGTFFRGLVVDRDYQVWIAANTPCGLARYDIVDKKWLMNSYDVLAGCVTPVGVSIDFEGFVWVVDQDAQLAYKVDRETLAVKTVDGFRKPYTYSDMTGSGLKLVNDKVDPPER